MLQPSKRHAYSQGGDNIFTPVEKELVFDIVSHWDWKYQYFRRKSANSCCSWSLCIHVILQDISDYDDVRYCCSGADVCLECWPLMTIAIKVIDTSLRGIVFMKWNTNFFTQEHFWPLIFLTDDFGFSHILWVYSGRRGVHCWVCDGKARRYRSRCVFYYCCLFYLLIWSLY